MLTRPDRAGQERIHRCMARIAEVERITKETRIKLKLNLDGTGESEIATGIGFFDHMLTLFCVHGFFDVSLDAQGDLNVDYHHTIEDVGLVLGDALTKALGDRKGIHRYGHAVTPMDDALCSVAVDLSNRPYLVYRLPGTMLAETSFDAPLVKEFFRSFANRAGLNLHINVAYGENQHHILESIFKTAGRALDQAISLDERIVGVRSSKGSL
jgi:imidazoleglycerol-phosphate dehydratase